MIVERLGDPLRWTEIMSMRNTRRPSIRILATLGLSSPMALAGFS